ncbi:MAG: TonB-dependent receptor [Saprospiraceae bacterium]|nr:TonB-dependent receptor [Saprospiraceae bacterium]
MIRSITLFLFLFLSVGVMAQTGTVNGTVTDESGPVIGATVGVRGSNTGTVTDFDGQYMLSLSPGTYTLEVRYVGYNSSAQEVTVRAGQAVTANFVLEVGVEVDEVVIVGSRSPNRTNVDAPVPVDVINVGDLAASAPQTNLNQLLHQTAPAFSSNTQTISDGTDHIDPASLRGLGPDQVLVLVNGKRRHTSSLVNVNGTFGRGNVGTDLNAIPVAAIQSIEVLRDGAAAQYGSDAIAGVINLRLRENVNQMRFAVNTGANFTAESSPQKDVDGEVIDIGVNYGLPLGANGGFINVTGQFDYRGWTNRMQSFSGQIFNGYNAVEWVALNQGADITTLSMSDVQNFAQQVSHFSPDLKSQIAQAADLAALQDLLDIDVTDAELAVRGQDRSDYNIRFGQSETRGGKVFANISIPLGDGLELYSFGGMSYRTGISGCFYRLPYQSRSYTGTYINGFLPKINSNITDKSLSAGLRGMINEWSVDFSNTYGTNEFLFHMTETHNATLESGSPTEFDAGGHRFTQNTANLDFSRYFADVGSLSGINVAFGSEYRYENYQVVPGTELSWGNYDINTNLVNSVTPDDLLVRDFFGNQRPSGSQCFAGFLPSNEVDANRSSVAGYVDVEFDFSESFLLGTALRFEEYSDFGSTFDYKIAARYKISDQFNLRGAHSTGFRAPSLHQIHFSRTSTIFVTEGGVTTAQEVGVFSNNSRVAGLLGIPQLEQEESQNFSLGFTAKFPDQNIKLTIDGYLVNIDNRIVLTGQFAPGSDPELISLFNQAQATRAAFFANAIDTESSGLDIVVSHSTVLGAGKRLTNDLAATFSSTEQVGEIHASDLLREKGLVDTYFDETSKIYLEEAVPRTKISLRNTLNVNDFTIYLRNTYFGETTEATDVSNLDPSVDPYYSGKVITDLSVGYDFSSSLSIVIGANNLLDVYPDLADETFTSSGRFIYSRRSPQFSYSGRHLFARIAFTLQ